MPDERSIALRLAEEAIKQFGHEQQFEFASNGHQLSSLKSAFEELGCTVHINMHRGYLVVSCADTPVSAS